MSKKQYKVEIIKEGALGTLFFGASKLPLDKIEDTLNELGQDGWGLEFMMIESHRFLLFGTREAAIVTLSREIS